MKKLAILFLVFSGCAPITKESRTSAYYYFAKDAKFKCAAYHFDLSANLTNEVPEMTQICGFCATVGE